MHLLLAALLEGQQTHSETVNEKGVWAAGEVELKVMYILVRAGILQTWHDVLDLCVYIFISFKKSYEWGGEGKGEEGFGSTIFNLQSFFISHYIWHLHKCTQVGEQSSW